MPHFEHDDMASDVVTASIGVWEMVKRMKRRETYTSDHEYDLSVGNNLHLDLHLQASTPSVQLWLNLLSPAPPQFPCQLPPGAQQLTRPDLLNVPQLGHIDTAEVTPGLLGDMVIGVLASCSRASHR